MGDYLKQVVPNYCEFNSVNICNIADCNFDTIYIAAPTGNRIAVNKDPTADQKNMQTIINGIKDTKCQRIVLMGTVDSVLRNNLPYGRNRLWLEEQILNHSKNVHILRLSSLIHKNIKKNILYDLKHRCYLDQINLNARLQWYDLNNLYQDINMVIKNNLQVHNLVSEAIANQEIVDKFSYGDIGNTNEVATIPVLPWSYSKDKIFESMKQYFND